jgi:hypothetical protein
MNVFNDTALGTLGMSLAFSGRNRPGASALPAVPRPTSGIKDTPPGYQPASYSPGTRPTSQGSASNPNLNSDPWSLPSDISGLQNLIQSKEARRIHLHSKSVKVKEMADARNSLLESNTQVAMELILRRNKLEAKLKEIKIANEKIIKLRQEWDQLNQKFTKLSEIHDVGPIIQKVKDSIEQMEKESYSMKETYWSNGGEVDTFLKTYRQLRVDYHVRNCHMELFNWVPPPNPFKLQR